MKESPDYKGAVDAILDYCGEDGNKSNSEQEYGEAVARIIHAVGQIREEEEPEIYFAIGDDEEDYGYEVANGNIYALEHIL